MSPLRSQWVSEGPKLHLRLLITEPHTHHSAMAAQDRVWIPESQTGQVGNRAFFPSILASRGLRSIISA